MVTKIKQATRLGGIWVDESSGKRVGNRFNRRGMARNRKKENEDEEN